MRYENKGMTFYRAHKTKQVLNSLDISFLINDLAKHEAFIENNELLCLHISPFCFAFVDVKEAFEMSFGDLLNCHRCL